jgi:predicted GNAT family N-acyltransferase
MTVSTKRLDKLPVEVMKVGDSSDLEIAQRIRYEVFVIGQHVPAEEEIDQYEHDCKHFLAKANGIPCGAARWRITEKGVKLERFAVLENYRGRGVGSALVQAVLRDIGTNPELKGRMHYLHAQLSAMPLYEKFGFKPQGEMFQECDIDHFKMVLS